MSQETITSHEPKEESSETMKVSWVNHLLNEQAKKERCDDDKRMSPEQVAEILQKKSESNDEHSIPKKEVGIDDKVISFKYTKPDPANYVGHEAYFQAKNNPSKKIIDANFQNIKNTSYGKVGEIMQKIEDVGNSPKAQFIDEQEFIDEQVRKGSIKINKGFREPALNQENRKYENLESIIRIADGEKSITEDSMSGSILLKLSQVPGMTEKITRGHAQGHTFIIRHIAGSPDFILEEIRLENGQKKKTYHAFHIETEKKTTSYTELKQEPSLAENNKPENSMEQLSRVQKKPEQKTNAYEQYKQDAEKLSDVFGGIAEAFKPVEIKPETSEDKKIYEAVPELDQSGTLNTPDTFDFGGIQLPKSPDELDQEVIENAEKEILNNPDLEKEVEKTVEEISTEPTTTESATEVTDNEVLEKRITKIEASLVKLTQEQEKKVQQTIERYPEIKQRLARGLIDRFEYGTKNPWAMIGYGIITILLGGIMVGYGVVGSGAKLGSLAYDKTKEVTKELLQKRFGDKEKKNGLEKKSLEDSSVSNKETPVKTTPEQKPVVEKTPEDKKKGFLEKTYEGKTEEEKQQAWERLRKTPLDKFLEPEKHPWPQSEGADKDYAIGEITVERYSPVSKKIHEIFKTAYEKIAYNELKPDISVEEFLEYAITNNLIE